MRFFLLPRFFWSCLLMLGVVLSSTACRKHQKPERLSLELLKVTVADELQTNRLEGIDGVGYDEHKDSPIHWQPWDAEMFKRAEAAKRLIFCVVTAPQFAGVHDVMRALESDQEMVQIINDHYVPVLLDGDWAREMQVLTTGMASEIGRSPGFPFFMWLEYNANPVACTPVSQSLPGGVKQVFEQSHAMILPMWQDDLEKWLADGEPGYVLSNSAYDQANRKKALRSVIDDRELLDASPELFYSILRQVLAEYDVFSHGFDSSGGVFPFRHMKLIAASAATPSIPFELREFGDTVIRDMTKHVLSSAMFDPLDDGVFYLRYGRSWSYPVFIKSGVNQAEIADAMFTVFRMTRDTEILHRALALMRSIERHNKLDSGLFALRPTEDSDPMKWMWSVDEVRDLLGDKDADWWIKATGMRELGNVPLEADPTRKLFRKNTLSAVMSVRQIADSLGVDPVEFANRYDIVRQRLLDARNARLRSLSRDDRPHLDTSLQMVRVYAAAYRMTGDEAYGREAVALLIKCREFFTDGTLIRMPGERMSEVISVGRAGHYARAILAALDVHGLQPNAGWNDWVDGLWKVVDEQFCVGEIIQEYAIGKATIDLPLHDERMIFGDSTMGLLSIGAERSIAVGVGVPEKPLELLRKVPGDIHQEPIVFGGQLQGMLERFHSPQAAKGAR